MNERYVVLGLGRARAPWLSNIANWATAGAVPAELTKCLSTGEARQRLSSMQPFSVALVDGEVSGIDRDFLDLANQANVPVVMIDDRTQRLSDWLVLGATAVLPTSFSPADLLYALSTHAQVVSTRTITDVPAAVAAIAATKGKLLSVCGPGGTGASTVAMALAQGLSSTASPFGRVLLGDLTRNSEQAMLHDAVDCMPAIEEVVDAFRTRHPNAGDLRTMTHRVAGRGYHLLPGVRRSSAWAALPPRAIDAAIAGLVEAFGTVVADITADFEGEATTGSMDVEERNAFARSAARRSDLVVVVGRPGVKGVHSLATILHQLDLLGVEPTRIVPVMVGSAKAVRRETNDALQQLTAETVGGFALSEVLFVDDRPVETQLREVAPLPKALVQPLTETCVALLQRPLGLIESEGEPEAVVPGSLWLHGYDEAAGQ